MKVKNSAITLHAMFKTLAGILSRPVLFEFYVKSQLELCGAVFR